MRKTVVGLGAVLLLVAVVAMGKQVTNAASVALPQNLTGGNGSTWQIFNLGGTVNGLPAGSSGGDCSDNIPGLSVEEASITAHGDATDGGMSFWLNNSIFVAPGTVDVTGSTLTAGPVTMSGLNVTFQYFAAPSTGTLRVLVSFQNAGGSPVTASGTYATNLGSDSGTVVGGTSSGDTTFTAADRWIVTDDASSDPAQTTVLFGPGSPTVTPGSVSQTVFDCANTNGVLANFSFTVPANSTRRLMFFTQLNDTTANGLSAATTFNTTPASGSELVSGLSVADLGEILNWAFAVPTPTSTPTVTATLQPTAAPTERPRVNVGGAVGAVAAAAGAQARENRAAAAATPASSVQVSAPNTGTGIAPFPAAGIAPPNTGDAGLVDEAAPALPAVLLLVVFGFVLASVAGISARRRP